MAVVRQRMLEEWNEFRTKAIPAEIDGTFLQILRRTFYAGAACFLHALMRDVSEGTGEPQPEDFDLMTGIEQELKKFHDDVQAGRA